MEVETSTKVSGCLKKSSRNGNHLIAFEDAKNLFYRFDYLNFCKKNNIFRTDKILGTFAMPQNIYIPSLLQCMP